MTNTLENESDNSSYYISSKQEIQRDNEDKNQKSISKVLSNNKIAYNEPNEPNLNQNVYFNNSIYDQNIIQDNCINNYTLSRNDDILINNFRPFSNGKIINNDSTKNIQNPNQLDISSTLSGYNSQQPTLSSSSTNSRLFQTSSVYSNSSNSYNCQRSPLKHVTSLGQNDSSVVYSSPIRSSNEHISNIEKQFKQNDSHYMVTKCLKNKHDDDIKEIKNRNIYGSNNVYNSNSSMNTNMNSNFKKYNNIEDLLYNNRINSNGMF